jgi:Mg-chelatase subunit ChlD
VKFGEHGSSDLSSALSFSSGSSRLEVAKKALKASVVRMVNENRLDFAGLMKFSVKNKVVREMTKRLTEKANLDQFHAAVDSLSPGGCTALHDAVVQALRNLIEFVKELLGKETKVIAFLSILTDGEDNSSSKENEKRVVELREQLSEICKLHAQIVTLDYECPDKTKGEENNSLADQKTAKKTTLQQALNAEVKKSEDLAPDEWFSPSVLKAYSDYQHLEKTLQLLKKRRVPVVALDEITKQMGELKLQFN